MLRGIFGCGGGGSWDEGNVGLGGKVEGNVGLGGEVGGFF